MRRVIYGGATSLDNFLTAADGGIGWLRWSDDAAAIMKTMWEHIDTIVMGRKTYEFARGGMPKRKSGRKAKAPAMDGIRTYVFSRTLPDEPGVEIVREDVVAFVRRLKEAPGKDICVMGGGELGRALFEGGLIDVVGLNIHPVLLGGGAPAFHPMTRPIALELEECRPIALGCVYASYRVLPPA
jgi:dihydrofolate reductase